MFRTAYSLVTPTIVTRNRIPRLTKVHAFGDFDASGT